MDETVHLDAKHNIASHLDLTVKTEGTLPEVRVYVKDERSKSECEDRRVSQSQLPADHSQKTPCSPNRDSVPPGRSAAIQVHRQDNGNTFDIELGTDTKTLRVPIPGHIAETLITYGDVKLITLGHGKPLKKLCDVLQKPNYWKWQGCINVH